MILTESESLGGNLEHVDEDVPQFVSVLTIELENSSVEIVENCCHLGVGDIRKHEGDWFLTVDIITAQDLFLQHWRLEQHDPVRLNLNVLFGDDHTVLAHVTAILEQLGNIGQQFFSRLFQHFTMLFKTALKIIQIYCL